MVFLSSLELLIKSIKATTEKSSTPSWDGKTFSENLRVLFTIGQRMLKALTHTVQSVHSSKFMHSSGDSLQKSCP